jgi:hypothetical protein
MMIYPHLDFDSGGRPDMMLMESDIMSVRTGVAHPKEFRLCLVIRGLWAYLFLPRSGRLHGSIIITLLPRLQIKGNFPLEQ